MSACTNTIAASIQQKELQYSVNLKADYPYSIIPLLSFQTLLLTNIFKYIHSDAFVSIMAWPVIPTLRWRHNGRDSVSNHQPHYYLLNLLFKCRSKKISKLRVTGLCVGNSPRTGEFPPQMASNAENVFIWWRHHEIVECRLRTNTEFQSCLVLFLDALVMAGAGPSADATLTAKTQLFFTKYFQLSTILNNFGCEIISLKTTGEIRRNLAIIRGAVSITGPTNCLQRPRYSARLVEAWFRAKFQVQSKYE